MISVEDHKNGQLVMFTVSRAVKLSKVVAPHQVAETAAEFQAIADKIREASRERTAAATDSKTVGSILEQGGQVRARTVNPT